MRIIKNIEPNDDNNIIQKIIDLEQELSRLKEIQSGTSNYGFILVHHQNIKHIIRYFDIVMIEAESNYATIYLQNGTKLLTSKTLKHWQSQIKKNEFIRTHNSFLVNRNHIQSINKGIYQLHLTNGFEAKYSRRMKSSAILSSGEVAKIEKKFTINLSKTVAH